MDQASSQDNKTHLYVQLSDADVADILLEHVVRQLPMDVAGLMPTRFYTDFDGSTYAENGTHVSDNPNLAAVVNALNVFQQDKVQLGPWQEADKQEHVPTILVVDDESSLRMLTCTIVETYMECHLLQAENGVEALKLCRSIVPDLVLLDMIMPEMDGFETGRELKRMGIPFVAFTSLSDQDSINRIIDLGCMAFLHKPAAQQQLIGTLRATLSQIKNRSHKKKTLSGGCEICTARGAVSAYLSISPDQAFEVIRELGRDNHGSPKDSAAIVTQFLEFMGKARAKHQARVARSEKRSSKNKQ